MPRGISVANANATLTTYATTFLWLQLHDGDPGPNGTNNLSSVTTRQAVTWSVPAGGSMSNSNSPSWGLWSGTSPETLTDVSVWNASTAGTFQDSIQLTSPLVVTTNFPLALAIGALIVTEGPLAA